MSSHQQHSHDHSAKGATRARLGWTIAIVAAVLIAEVIGAWLSGSLSLLADAGHMFSDLIGLIIALLASIIALRPPTDRRTFGYQRVEVFAALFNGLILLVVAGFVAFEGVSRLIDAASGRGEVEVKSGLMLVIAVVGLVANFVGLLLLRSGAKESINVRGAYLDVFGDLLGSVAVIVAALVIMITGFAGADAIASLVIAAMIVPRSLSLLRDVFHVLSESTPADTNIAEIRQHILTAPGVAAVHDVHVWAITSGSPVFSAHVVVDSDHLDQQSTDALLDKLSHCLSEHYDVSHSTFQLEPASHAAHENQYHD